MMKKFLKLFWQLLFFPALYIPYGLLDEKVIVKWLGCSCPSLDVNGNHITSKFNANDFTRLFWALIVLVVVGITLFKMRKIAKWYYKLIYVVFIITVSIIFASKFYSSMLWD